MNASLAAQLSDPRRSGIYSLPTKCRASLQTTAESLGLACFEVDLGASCNLRQALAAFGRELGFPDWYGQNLDALYDCLTDFSWRESVGYVLLLTHVDDFHAADASAFAAVYQVLVAVGEEWRAQGYPFWGFLTPGQQGVPPFPLSG